MVSKSTLTAEQMLLDSIFNQPQSLIAKDVSILVSKMEVDFIMRLFEQLFWNKPAEGFVALFNYRAADNALEDVSLTVPARNAAAALFGRLRGVEWTYEEDEDMFDETMEELDKDFPRNADGYIIANKTESDKRSLAYLSEHLEYLTDLLKQYRTYDTKTVITEDMKDVIMRICMEVMKINFIAA